MSALPRETRKGIGKAIGKSVVEMAMTARLLAPSGGSGTARDDIRSFVDISGLSGSVAGDNHLDRLRNASIEFGRKRGRRGATAPQPYFWPAYRLMRRRLRSRIRRAVNKAVKKTSRG